MKLKNILKFILPVVAFIMTSCSKEEIKFYDGTPNVYFYWSVEREFSWADLKDSTEITFAYYSARVTDTVYNIPINVAAAPTDYDRVINFEVLPGSNAVKGKHYDWNADQLILEAGKNQAILPITFHRTEDMATDTIIMDIALKDSKDFKVNMSSVILDEVTGKKRNLTTWRIYVSDIVTKPGTWLDFLFGKFSLKKYKLISEVLNISYSDFASVRDIPTVMGYATIVQRYLNLQRQNGNIIYDEDGTEMTMGSYVQ